MSGILLDSDFNIIYTPIDDIRSLTWSPRWTECGTFTAQIDRKHIQAVRSAAYFYHADTHETGMIEAVHYADTLTFSGRMLDALLERQVICKTFNAVGNAEQIARQAVLQYGVNGDSPLPKLYLGLDNGYTPTINTQFTGIALSDALYKMLNNVGMSWRLRYDLATDRIIFDVVQGLDRTQNQNVNAWAQFSTEAETLASFDYVYDDSDSHNFAYVGGTGEGSSRDIVWVDRRKDAIQKSVFVDARDVKNENNIPAFTFISYGASEADEGSLFRVSNDLINWQTYERPFYFLNSSHDVVPFPANPGLDPRFTDVSVESLARYGDTWIFGSTLGRIFIAQNASENGEAKNILYRLTTLEENETLTADEILEVQTLAADLNDLCPSLDLTVDSFGQLSKTMEQIKAYITPPDRFTLVSFGLTNETIIGVEAIDGIFLAFGDRGAVLKSEDGLSWMTTPHTVETVNKAKRIGDYYFLMGTSLKYSTDGSLWVTYATGLNDIADGAYLKGIYCFISSDGQYVYGTEPWNLSEPSEFEDYGITGFPTCAIVSGNQTFCVVADNDIFVGWPDSWAHRKPPDTGHMIGVTYGGKRFAICTDTKCFYAFENSAVWNESTITTETLNGIAGTYSKYGWELYCRGAQKLDEYKTIESIEGTASDNGVLQYGIDYNIGDLCDVSDLASGIIVQKRINGIDLIFEAGRNIIQPIFGDETLNLKKYIRREVYR